VVIDDQDRVAQRIEGSDAKLAAARLRLGI
jgi:hypothetical protein